MRHIDRLKLRRRVPRIALAIVAPLAVALAIAACGSSSKSSTTKTTRTTAAVPTAAVVKTAHNAKLGSTVLVNDKGLTLYALSVEKNGKFICTGSCTSTWPPLTVPSGTKPTGASSLGTIMRPDGTTQVTYKGMPLYHFAMDTKPGDTGGQGFKDVGTWSAVKTSGAATTTPAPTSTGGAGGYGY
jgi:predicted lipoprotein with Yx(FWY)xxD motif